jgi:hypothetical protein
VTLCQQCTLSAGGHVSLISCVCAWYKYVITKDGINEDVNTLNGVISRAERETEFRVSMFRVCQYNEGYKEKRGRLNWY